MGLSEDQVEALASLLVGLQEKGVRRVRDVEYWGLPYGTPIVPGMKPRRSSIPVIEFDMPPIGSVHHDMDNPPPYLYRSVSEEDWEKIKKRGNIRSDGRMNVADYEGTVAADRDPAFYLPNRVGAEGRIIRIAFDPEDGWWKDHDGYWKTPKAIPLSRVDAVTPPRIDQQLPDDYTNGRLAYNIQNWLYNAVVDVPGYDGYGPVYDFNQHSYVIGRELPREPSDEQILKYIQDLRKALKSHEIDPAHEWYGEQYAALSRQVTEILDAAELALDRKNRKPSAIQMRLPGMPKVPHTPERDSERLDRFREDDRRHDARRSALHMEELLERYGDGLYDDQNAADRASYYLTEDYGVDPDPYTEMSDVVVSGGDWSYFGACRDIRESAYDILGFSAYDRTADLHLHGGNPGWGNAASTAKNPDALAYYILDRLRKGERTDMPFYRGIAMWGYDEEAFINDLRSDGTFDLPIASFAGNYESATIFGDSVVFKLERGARFVQGGHMGIPDSIREQLEETAGGQIYDEDYIEDPTYSEIVTGGRFKVTHIKRQGLTVIVTIKQVGVFNPESGRAQKSINERWKYAWMFNNSYAAMFADAIVELRKKRDTRSNKTPKAERGKNVR